jgi:hypothetical protein
MFSVISFTIWTTNYVSFTARGILTLPTKNEWVEVSETHSIGYIWGRILARDTERKREKEV